MAKDDKYWVGFDLGGTKMFATVFDASFEPIARCRKKTRGREGTDAGLKRMISIIEEALSEADIDSDKVAGIGVGAPGPLNLKNGILIHAPNLGWRDAPVRNRLHEAFGCPVTLANDVDVGVYGEYRFGAGREATTVAGIFPGTGIGGGCVYKGELVSGTVHSAMEIGHVNVVPDGPMCGCGRRGCLEAVAGRLAIAGAAAAAAHRGEAPFLMEAAGTDVSQMRSGVLADAVKAGDHVVEAILRQAAGAIGRASSTLINLLLPEVIVLGGGLVEAMPELFLAEVESAARSSVMPSFRDLFAVRVAELGDDAAVLGAAAWAKACAKRDG